LAIAYLLVVLVMAFLETWLVYPAPRPYDPKWRPADAQHEEAWIDSTDGVRVHAWFYERPDAERVVLYCHGNAETVPQNDGLARTIRDELHADVLVFDYRGYGRTGGTPYEAGVIADASAAQRWVSERTGRRLDEVVVVGRSLGGGVATALAAENGAAALVLQDTFTSLPDAASSHYPWLPVHWVMDNRYESLERHAHYRGPVYVSHARDDRVVPNEQGRRLYASVRNERKAWVEFPDRSHLDPVPRAYWSDLRRWLDGNAKIGVRNTETKQATESRKRERPE
jgi:fermentation-respiration switch protein FrsA (DUF1100 family)